MANQAIFSDVISNISISAGVVRIDYVILSETNSETKEVKFAHSHTQTMPIDGFLRSLELQEKIKEEMIQKGIIKLNNTEIK